MIDLFLVDNYNNYPLCLPTMFHHQLMFLTSRNTLTRNTVSYLTDYHLQTLRCVCSCHQFVYTIRTLLTYLSHKGSSYPRCCAIIPDGGDVTQVLALWGKNALNVSRQSPNKIVSFIRMYECYNVFV